MNAAHLHLMVNHLPIVGTPVILALLLWGLVRRSRDIQRAALGGAVVLAALAYPVFLTGEPAEEQVEDATWMNERMVHEHEERAEAALIAVLATAAIALATLWQTRGGRSISMGLSGATVAGLLLSAGLFGWAALAGGAIRHDESRSGLVAAAPADDAGSRESAGGGHDRDDD